MFDILRNLECRGLIVKQPTIMRTKEARNGGEYKNGSNVNTNIIHLYRYAKHLGCQQRLEITKGDKPSMDGVKEDVCIRDFLPALKVVCDKLEQANGKVLVVKDIKKELGYKGPTGHRAWRNIHKRLEDARVIKKEVSCLRLLKNFSPKYSEPKTPVKLGRRGQVTDQLMELPIEQQIYDVVDAEGSKGLTITEKGNENVVRHPPGMEARHPPGMGRKDCKLLGGRRPSTPPFWRFIKSATIASLISTQCPPLVFRKGKFRVNVRDCFKRIRFDDAPVRLNLCISSLN